MSKLLLPHKYKKIGWILLVPSFILGVVISFKDFEFNWLTTKVFAIYSDEAFGTRTAFHFIVNNLADELIALMFIVGAIFAGFSREKKEDEFIANLRLSSLLWSVYVNYILLALMLIFIYGTAFFTVMMYNMFTVLIIFLVRFNYILYKTSKSAADEK